MTFLPIVDRELRIAARRSSTRRVRWWSALIAFLMSFVGLALLSIGSTSSPGKQLFTLLSWYTFALCVLAGVILTADAVSEEKREGTLGLLFLTGLKGYDVVLGKLMARSLNAFYALLALIPMLAIPVLTGGVTGGELWRMALALTNALFFSLAAGMFVSVWARTGAQAMGGAFALILIQMAGFQILAEGLQRTQFKLLGGLIVTTNPFYAFFLAPESNAAAGRSGFWRSLAGSHLLAWLLIAAASLALPRMWRQGSESRRGWLRRRLGAGRLNGWRHRVRREKLLQANPVYWLILRDGEGRGPIWLFVILWALVVAFWSFSLVSQGTPRGIEFFYYPFKGAGFVLKAFIAFYACRFFSEGRRSGAIEVLLATPLRSREIVRGQWMGLRRLFAGPIVAFVLCCLIPIGMQAAHSWRGVVVTDLSWDLVRGTLIVFWIALGMILDLLAVAYVGAWLALSMNRPALAAGATILFVLVLPSIGFCGLDLLVDLFFILWASTNLAQDLRWTLNKPYQQPIRIPPRTFSASPQSPPVIRTS